MPRPTKTSADTTRNADEFKHGTGRFSHTTEAQQNRADVSGGLCKPAIETKALVDSWKRGELVFHMKVGIRTELLGGEECQFCADIQHAPPGLTWRPCDRAVPVVKDFVPEGLRQEKDWLERLVLVSVVERRKYREGVIRQVALPAFVGLRLSDDCPICHPDSREARGAFTTVDKPGIEGVPVGADRICDSPSLLRGEYVWWSTPLGHNSPGKVVEATPELVSDGAQPQRDWDRSWRQTGDGHSEPVTIHVVVTRNGVLPLSVLILSEGDDVGLQEFGLSYRPTPLQPGAPERIVHTERVIHPAKSTTASEFRQTLLEEARRIRDLDD